MRKFFSRYFGWMICSIRRHHIFYSCGGLMVGEKQIKSKEVCATCKRIKIVEV